ncbi:MAG: ABC transporter ATP-binding protein [Clostridia bacterium]|nr:ABC transporter ATP-binding protein [Clostridia bacterium]
MIKLKNIYKTYDGKPVFENFSLDIPLNKTYCIMGESGIGKTTLLNLIMGLSRPDKGSVEGVPPKISALFQEDRLCEPFSPVSNVRAVTGKSVPQAQIISLLADLGLEGNENIPVLNLSGGMRRRVAIARALLAQFDLLVLDEPFKGLDDATRERVAAVILTYCKNKTLIVSTHNIRDVALLNAVQINL